jgi:hypothetical protein
MMLAVDEKVNPEKKGRKEEITGRVGRKEGNKLTRARTRMKSKERTRNKFTRQQLLTFLELELVTLRWGIG